MVQMTKILVFKDAVRSLYGKYSMYILPAIKFLVMLVGILVMNYYVGEGGTLNNPVVAVILAAVCSMLPLGIITIVYALLLVANIYSMAAEMAIVTIILYMVMYIFYFRFSAKYGFVLLVMPITMAFKIPYIMPIVLGVAMSPSAIVAMIFGSIEFFMMKFASGSRATIVSGESETGMDKASTYVKNVLTSREMLITVITFVLIALIVYFIKRMSVDYSTTIAIVVGGTIQIIIFLCATYIFEIEAFEPIWLTGILASVCAIVMYFLQYFIVAADYSRTEFTQFEDDDYYYYVKAVPKIKVTATDVKVKHINVKKR